MSIRSHGVRRTMSESFIINAVDAALLLLATLFITMSFAIGFHICLKESGFKQYKVLNQGKV